jgi:hypothetical protein
MFSSPTITERGSTINVSYGSDNGLFPVFSIEAVKDEEETIKQGREIFKDVEWVKIHIVGNNLNEISRPVTDEDRRRFPQHYQAFKNQGIQLNSGTPLTEWTLIGKAMAMNLKSVNIHTVEQLAAVADGNLTWMGARELQAKAKSWLESAEKNAGLSAVQAENEKLKVEMEALKNQMAALLSGEGKKRKSKGDVDAEDIS